jgi:uncharacterized protein YjdB
VTVAVGETAQLSATVTDSAGHVLSGRAVAWTTSDGGVATVDSTGRVAGVAVGTATITANSEGKTGTAAVDVREDG